MNNAWNFNGNNGNLNNNNVNNSNQCVAVANLFEEYNMSEEEFFIKQMELVFSTQKNKRRGGDSLAYENNIIALTIRGMYARLNRTLRIKHNYAFLVSIPTWREIMATEFEGRKIDHEICDRLIPAADKLLSPYTFNNRVGKGLMAAINQLIEHINEVSWGYTKPTRCIKIDFSGYFPNALWNYAETVINKVIDHYKIIYFPDSEKPYFKWLTMIALHCNPAGNCELRTPKQLWKEHIKPEKSILDKPEGIGAAIGRLIWQTSMCLYINDIIEWLTDDCKIKLVCFVDDIVMIVPEEQHQYALSLLPELRTRLADRNVKLNEKKFYDQPYQYGLEFLGSHIKPYRIHLNNVTYNRAIKKIQTLNTQKYRDIDALVASFNSYSGLLKNRTDYKRLIKLKNLIAKDWWKFVYFNRRRLCLGYRKGFSVNDRLNRKYNLKLKKYDKRRTARAA